MTPTYMALFSVDAVNAFNAIERSALRAALVARPELHPLLPLYGMLYTDCEGELWFYDDNGDYYETFHSKRGVRQGCVLGTFLFCLAMKPIYDRLRALLGPSGLLLTYSDDIYCAALPVLVGGGCDLCGPVAVWKKRPADRMGTRQQDGTRLTSGRAASGASPAS